MKTALLSFQPYIFKWPTCWDGKGHERRVKRGRWDRRSKITFSFLICQGVCTVYWLNPLNLFSLLFFRSFLRMGNSCFSNQRWIFYFCECWSCLTEDTLAAVTTRDTPLRQTQRDTANHFCFLSFLEDNSHQQCHRSGADCWANMMNNWIKSAQTWPVIKKQH